jgi:hypothetical protein
LLPVKIKGHSYSFDIAESKYGNQISLPPTNVKVEELEPKNYVCNKGAIYWFLITPYTECPTSYRTRHFFDNFTTNEDIATKFEVDLPHCVRNVTRS